MNDSLYREQLLDIYKEQSNRGVMEDPNSESVGSNPFCGDTVKLQLKIEDGKITDAAYDGDACMVSIASSSLLTDEIKGKTVEEAKKISKDDVLDMVGVKLTTSRVKCATLVLDALQSALEEYDGK